MEQLECGGDPYGVPGRPPKAARTRRSSVSVASPSRVARGRNASGRTATLFGAASRDQLVHLSLRRGRGSGAWSRAGPHPRRPRPPTSRGLACPSHSERGVETTVPSSSSSEVGAGSWWSRKSRACQPVSRGAASPSAGGADGDGARGHDPEQVGCLGSVGTPDPPARIAVLRLVVRAAETTPDGEHIGTGSAHVEAAGRTSSAGRAARSKTRFIERASNCTSTSAGASRPYVARSRLRCGSSVAELPSPNCRPRATSRSCAAAAATIAGARSPSASTVVTNSCAPVSCRPTGPSVGHGLPRRTRRRHLR